MLELNNADTAFSTICLQESWLTDDSDLSQYQLPNYNLIHQGKKCSGHGGLLSLFTQTLLSCCKKVV